jgi:arylsulfatase A-like enzyme
VSDAELREGRRRGIEVHAVAHHRALLANAAGSLTGRNHHSVSMGNITETATPPPGYTSVLPNTKAPLAVTLKLNGYSTAQFGKCHEVPVWQTSPAGPFTAWPTGGGGFEYFYGFIGGRIISGTRPCMRAPRASHWGGTRNGTIVHWPKGIDDKGGIRNQFTHVIDLAPTVLEAAGIPEPTIVNGVMQSPYEGTSLLYSFNDADAPEWHETQYFEMFCNRGIYHKGWSAVTKHRTPWQMSG